MGLAVCGVIIKGKWNVGLFNLGGQQRRQLECGQFLFINFYQLLVLIASNDEYLMSVPLETR